MGRPATESEVHLHCLRIDTAGGVLLYAIYTCTYDVRASAYACIAWLQHTCTHIMHTGIMWLRMLTMLRWRKLPHKPQQQKIKESTEAKKETMRKGGQEIKICWMVDGQNARYTGIASAHVWLRTTCNRLCVYVCVCA